MCFLQPGEDGQYSGHIYPLGKWILLFAVLDLTCRKYQVMFRIQSEDANSANDTLTPSFSTEEKLPK